MKHLLMLLCLVFFAGQVFARAPLPGDSVYQLEVRLTDQDGHDWPWAARRGHVQVVSMFYTSCTMVCPMVVDTMKLTAKALDESARGRLDLLLVSFDPARDSVAALREYADRRKLNAPPWTLARAESQDARQLAALLGLQYRQLPDGDFNHSSELILLDADGRILARSDVMGRLDPDFVQAVRKALAAK
ncbi:SCO family protein [Dyella halodurans]|uniref:SCO family protein n=1 Tax=Dyella halodurans TaxID=1920171 RepID=A0ABV9BXN9_9GAMM|nr:SCO family protein [Dyella halodurans]